MGRNGKLAETAVWPSICRRFQKVPKSKNKTTRPSTGWWLAMTAQADDTAQRVFTIEGILQKAPKRLRDSGAEMLMKGS
jgi:hypothetical protein